MKFSKAALLFNVGVAIALPASPANFAKAGGYSSLEKRVGCPEGGFLVYSTTADGVTNTFCIGTIAAATLGWSATVISATAITYLRNAWNNGQCSVPVSATAPADGGSKRRDLGMPSKRDATVTGYTFQVDNGYDNYGCQYTLTDTDWGNAVQAITEYMVKYDDECVEVIVRGDNGFEAQTLTWINTDDGVNHKTCG